MTFFDELRQSFRIADAFDIAFVSILLYSALTWFRETTSRPVVVGASLLVFVYFFARWWDMYMTVLVFQTVFVVLLVALVVVFQEDLRRAFERVARWGTIPEWRRPAREFRYLDAICALASDLATKRIGALIVIKGHDTLDRHSDGGVLVQGQVSRALLESIFDPHSLGHDGAVIIEADRIKQFGVHLPLSKNMDEIGTRGTRHSAALGLAERTDALVIVVSEERGTMCVAQSGKLKQMASVAELEGRLEAFCEHHFPKSAESPWKHLVKQHAGLKVVSLMMACLAWFMLSFRAETVYRNFKIPIEYRNLPQDYEVITSDGPVEAHVILSGYERAFKLLDLNPSALKVSIDLSEIRQSQNFLPIEDQHIKRPANLSVYSIEPRAVWVEAEEWVSVELPVEVRTEGVLPSEFELAGVKVEPARVPARVWRSQVSSTTVLLTEPIRLAGMTKSTTVSGKLDVPGHVRLAAGVAPAVRVTLEVKGREVAK